MAIMVKLKDVPEGGIIEPRTDGDPLFLTKVGGVVMALGSTCTHAGCNVAFGEITGRTISCPCHGSEFDLQTGEAVKGPAEKPLRKYKIRVEGDDVYIE